MGFVRAERARMRAGYIIQTLVTIAVFSSLLASDAVAYLLDQHPTSTVLWFLCLNVFHSFDPFGSPFQIAARHILTTYVALGAIAAAVLAHYFRIRVVIGFFVNISCMLMMGLAYSSLRPHPSLAAALGPSIGSNSIDIWLVFALAAASLIAAVVSHVLFFRHA